MKQKLILLIEHDRHDEDLTRRALLKIQVFNTVLIYRDAADALNFLFATGKHADRDPRMMPEVVLLDSKIPKIGGLEVLRRLRADFHTRELPVVVLTRQLDPSDLIALHQLKVAGCICKSPDLEKYAAALGRVGLDKFLGHGPARSKLAA
jgi:two-component system response regulator